MPDEMLYNERELLQLVAEGSETAFRKLFHAYRKRLYTYVYKITASGEIAEDTLQDIFLKLWARKETLPEIENLAAYLQRMAYNNVMTGFRRMAKETLILAELKNELHHDANHPGMQLVSKEVRAYIRQTINRLTPQQKRVFLLSREEGLKQEEIAAQLNISISTVKKHMVEALRFLRQEIGQTYGTQAVAVFVIYHLGI